MGKHRPHGGKHINIGMDQSGERGRSGGTERGSVLAAGRTDNGVDLPAGDAGADSGRPSNIIPLGKSGFRRGVQRLRLPGRAAPEVRRTLDAREVDAILNDASVFPIIAMPGKQKFDTAALIADPRNIALVCEGGALIFACHEPGYYEVHIGFLAGFRGAYAKQALAIAVRLMFMTMPALVLWMRVPDNNPAARLFYAACGAKKEFRREAAWPTADGMIGQSYWAIRYDSWILSNSELGECGEYFIAKLNDARLQMGHDFEIFHNCALPYLGALMLMACAGQLDKAVILYNRFASFANLPRFALVSHVPAVIDTGETLVQFVENEFKVFLCK